MRKMQKGIPVLMGLVLATMVMSAPIDVFAQGRKSVGGLVGGERLHPGSYSNQRASRNVSHARDYARDIYTYSRVPHGIEPSIAKAESEELGKRITQAQQDLSVVGAELGDDAAATKSLKSIQDHLAAAQQQHAMLHEECCKDSVNGLTCMKHCNQILLELDKAQTEHDALMRSLEIQGQPTE